MHPLLFRLGGFEIHTYGVMIVIGFLIGLYLLFEQAKVENVNPERVVDIAFWALFAGLLGGRVVYILTRLSIFIQHPVDIFKFWEGGLVFYGGFIGGISAVLYFAKKYQIPKIKMLDMSAPTLAIAHVFGRLGCFFAGCCYGKVAQGVPWAVTFWDTESAAPLGVPLHPTQLYDALNALIIFVTLLILRRRKRFTGQLAATYMIVYSIGRYIVEIYRGDGVRGYIIPPYLSTSQFISIFIFVTGVYLWRRWSHKYPLLKKNNPA